MAIQLTINGTDRTERVVANSIKIENILTQKRDTCEFRILSHAGNSITPVVGQEVIITLDSTRIFGGVIVLLEQRSLVYGMVEWHIRCEDYTRLLDRKLVPDSYTDMTVDEIMADFMTRYLPQDFSISGVDAPINISAIKFNYKPISKCIEQLAKTIGYDWYVDYNKVIYLFPPSDNPASVDIEDANGTHEYESLVIRRDNSQVRNTIIVRGGEYLASNFTAEIEANGTDTIFPLGYKYSNFHCTLTGDPLTVGTDYIDQPDDVDVLYNFAEKIIKFKDADKPTAGSVIRVSGRPYLPVIVRLRSPADISTMSSLEGGDGVYEYLVLDKTITSKEAARQRASAELETYATTLSEGEFVTTTTGLRAGQKIRINSASRGIDENFIINKVTFSQFENNTFKYKISLVTTKTFDLIDLLIRLSLQKTDEITISDTDVAEIIVDLSDSMVFSEALGTFSAQEGDYRWGPGVGVQRTNSVVISQIYGGGGNVGATYRNDFIELHNRSNQDISLATWSVQYTSATGTAWAKVNLSGTIPAGGYYLVQMGSSGSNGSVLPTPDATDSTGMSTTTGKVFLCNNQTLLTGANPHSSAIVDKVGYGTTANGYEGSGPTGTNLTVTTAAFRNAAGQTDTNENSTDFSAATPSPRNTASQVLYFDAYWNFATWV